MIYKSTLFAFVLISCFPVSTLAEDWVLPWWTVDGGGELRMIDLTNETEWVISGTIGQWDATSADGSASGRWELTGGFWSASIAETDFLFKDSFEDPTFSR